MSLSTINGSLLLRDSPLSCSSGFKVVLPFNVLPCPLGQTEVEGPDPVEKFLSSLFESVADHTTYVEPSLLCSAADMLSDHHTVTTEYVDHSC